jgi:hypothetical protein
MKQLLLLLSVILAAFAGRTQTSWPQTLTAPDGSMLKIYQPQPDSFRDNSLTWRSAFSLLESGAATPSFGSFQAFAMVETDRDQRLVDILSAKVLQLDLPSVDPAALRRLKAYLDSGMAGISLSLDELLSELDMTTAEKSLSRGLSTTPPRILYSAKPAILVTIDGEPRTQHNTDLGVAAVVNTPYTILKVDYTWYLYGGRHWYAAQAPMGPYAYTRTVPDAIAKAQATIDKADSGVTAHGDSAREGAERIAQIIVSTTPAELIQSDGEPQFSLVAGTGLLYLSNSDNDVFIDTGTQLYYVLLSGRWYRAPRLEGPWTFVAADALPADFARIPEGSAKDGVLSSVAGTPAAREAVTDAQIPQTARIDRKTATTQVTYDGAPQFEKIRGTQLEYAVNTPSTVLRYKHRYYCVDNGVWFVSTDAGGPWRPADSRPDEVDLIPPDCPVYNCKYVYVYDVTPDYIRMGYTPGYLNSFIYGPTVVYGTGFYYNPWWGGFYYPRPWTWGFNMWYDPWYGWTFGYDFALDWFNFGLGWDFWFGGWWGPWIYRPPYVWHHFRGHGLYEHDVRRIRMADHQVNLYSSRRDIVRTPPGGRLYTDRDGHVFRQDGNGGWQQRDGNQWKPLDGRAAPTIGGLERQEQSANRGQMRLQNFQQLRGGGGGFPRGGGGFGRPGRH